MLKVIKIFIILQMILITVLKKPVSLSVTVVLWEFVKLVKNQLTEILLMIVHAILIILKTPVDSVNLIVKLLLPKEN